MAQNIESDRERKTTSESPKSVKKQWHLKQGVDPSKTKLYTSEELKKIRKQFPEKAKLIDAFEKKYNQLKPTTKKAYAKNYLWYWYSKDKEKYKMLIDKVE